MLRVRDRGHRQCVAEEEKTRQFVLASKLFFAGLAALRLSRSDEVSLQAWGTC